MDIEKLVEDGARAICAANASVGTPDDSFAEDGTPQWRLYAPEARAVLAIALAAAAEEVEAWSHNSTGTRNLEQAMQEAAQDTLAEKIAERFRTLATQLGAANG